MSGSARDELVEGPLARGLVVLAVPLVAQNLVQVVNQVVDVYWLGRLSEGAVAGVGLVVPLLGVGDSRGPFALNALAVAVNVVLDPILIFGWFGLPALGVRGAALASLAGYGVGLLVGLALVLRGREGLVYTRDALRVGRGTLREIVDVGLPNGAQTLGQQAARLGVVAVVAAAAGPAGLAAYTVGARVATVAVVPALGLQQAAQSVVGQNLGAGAVARARRATWLGVGIAAVGLAPVGAVQWALPGTLAHLFVPDASALGMALTVDYLRILAYGYPAIGATYLLLGGFNAARRTRTSMVATLLQYWAVRLPVAAGGALLLGYGVHAAFWAVTLSNVAAAVALAWYYRRRTRGGMLHRAAEAAAG